MIAVSAITTLVIIGAVVALSLNNQQNQNRH